MSIITLLIFVMPVNMASYISCIFLLLKLKLKLRLTFCILIYGVQPLNCLWLVTNIISFVDDFKRYCWIFPLTLKFKALDTFKYFKILMEK